MNDQVKKILRKELAFFEAVRHVMVAVLESVYRLLSKITFWVGGACQFVQWKFPFTHAPLFYDHEMTLLAWENNKAKTLSWLDRGYNNLKYIRQFENPLILELGCGSGFYAKKFYALIPKARVYACDFDKAALKKAKYGKPYNVTFVYADITSDMPVIDGITNVVWDACINFFTDEMQEKLLKQIAGCLDQAGGILSGSGVLVNGQKMWQEYDYLFQSESDVKNLMMKYFKYVKVHRGEKGTDESTVFFVATNSEELKGVLCK